MNATLMHASAIIWGKIINMNDSVNEPSTIENGKKKINSNILKWAFILALIAFAIIKNQDFTASAIEEISKTKTNEIIVCLALANLFFLFEGIVISQITKTCDNRLTVFQGITCAYMCAFYRLATLGSGNGIAQLYYYNVHGIDVATGTGMAVSQYTIQKITIAVFGILAFFGIVWFGDSDITKYSKYMLMGTVLIGFVCVFLLLITVSKKISDLVMLIARKIVKPKWKLYKKLDEAQNAIDCLQNQSRKIWKNKWLFVQVVLLDIGKLASWYMIPGFLFSDDYDVNLITCMLLMAVCNMVGCVMIAPSGVGTLEFVFAIFFSAIIPNGKAIAATIIIYRFFTWILPFCIGIIPAAFVKKKK